MKTGWIFMATGDTGFVAAIIFQIYHSNSVITFEFLAFSEIKTWNTKLTVGGFNAPRKSQINGGSSDNGIRNH